MPDSPWNLAFCAKQTEAKIAEILNEEGKSKQLAEAMRYSCLGAGKKIRPFLLLKFAEILGANPATCLNFAAAIELIHSYSLIHDDLPAMDDDDFRRGQPSCHKKFDEATAILTGDALLSLSFEIASKPQKEISAERQLEIIGLMAKNSGPNGMVGGQMLDLNAAKHSRVISPAEILQIHHLKTGKMFIAAAQIGAILGGADEDERWAAVDFASNFGIAFQLQDDLDDFENDRPVANQHYQNHKGLTLQDRRDQKIWKNGDLRKSYDDQQKSAKLQAPLEKSVQTKQFAPDATLNLASLIGFDETLKMLEEFKYKASKNLQIFGKKAAMLEGLLKL